MAGDLEDFLKRAAQRRQEKLQQDQRREQARRPARREYTDAGSERRIRREEDFRDDDVRDDNIRDDGMLVTEVAESVEEGIVRAKLQRTEEKRIRQVAEDARQAARSSDSSGRPRSSQPPSDQEGPPPINLVAELRAMLSKQRGVRQAVLLREILDRPVDRW